MKRYVKSSTEYKRIKDELEAELEDGIDPLHELTEAGEYVNYLCSSVEDELNVYAEPSVQAGQGGVWFYDNTTDETVAGGYDYQDFNNKIVELALEASNEGEFKSSYKSYLERMIG